MGYDSFGMPAENAAKKEQGHPEDVTARNISSIKSDQRRMGTPTTGGDNSPHRMLDTTNEPIDVPRLS